MVSRIGANTVLPMPRLTITRPATRSGAPSIGAIGAAFLRGAAGAAAAAATQFEVILFREVDQ